MTIGTGLLPNNASAAPPRNLDEAFQQVAAALPEMRDELRNQPQTADEALLLSRDIKQALCGMVGGMTVLPETAEDAHHIALNVAAAAAMLGALDGSVAYVASKMPLPLPLSGQSGFSQDSVADGFNRTSPSAIEGSREQLQDSGEEALREVSQMGKEVASNAVATIQEIFNELTLEEFKSLVSQAMLLSYTVGVADSCLVCLANTQPVALQKVA